MPALHRRCHYILRISVGAAFHEGLRTLTRAFDSVGRPGGLGSAMSASGLTAKAHSRLDAVRSRHAALGRRSWPPRRRSCIPSGNHVLREAGTTEPAIALAWAPSAWRSTRCVIILFEYAPHPVASISIFSIRRSRRGIRRTRGLLNPEAPNKSINWIRVLAAGPMPLNFLRLLRACPMTK